MTLVDANVVLDLVTQDPNWSQWSLAALDAAAAHGPLLINDVVFAELSVGYKSLADLEAFLAGTGFQSAHLPKEALFRAGKVFALYRRAGGTRTGVLPDFFIGAHAEASDLPLLTRDARRYRNYFPSVRLITPEG